MVMQQATKEGLAFIAFQQIVNPIDMLQTLGMQRVGFGTRLPIQRQYGEWAQKVKTGVLFRAFGQTHQHL
jgi:hypothetical protein